MSRFEMTLLHPYETAEALCRRRNKVSTAAEWLVIGADTRWYVPSMISMAVRAFFKGILTVVMFSCKKMVKFYRLLQENCQIGHVSCKRTVNCDMFSCKNMSNLHSLSCDVSQVR